MRVRSATWASLYLLLTFLFLSVPLVRAERVALRPSSRDIDVRLLESGAEIIRFEVLVGAFERTPVLIEGKTFYRLSIRGESSVEERGAPDVPQVCRSVVIPDEGEMAVEVVSVEYEEIAGMPVAPSKGTLERTVDPSTVPYEFGEAYASGEWYPKVGAWSREPYILRDFRGLCVVVQPISVRAADEVVRVCTRMVVEVRRVGPGGANVLTDHHRDRMNGEFAKIYDSHFINKGIGRYVPTGEAGEMLILANDAFHADLLPLVAWKNQMGVKTTLVDLSAAGGDSASVRAFIRSFYDSTDLAFVLLVGDAAQFPYPTSYGAAADPNYALVAGSDMYPDILVGRLSASTQYQLRTQVERTIAYEKTPQEGERWYGTAAGIASADGPGDDEEYDYEHVDVIRDHLLDFTYTDVDRIYDPGATAEQVTVRINEGRGLIVYCGHGSRTSWGTTGFSNSHVAALANRSRLPFIFDVACLNGEFVSGTCFAEAWLRATSGSSPTGAIAVYASSINQYWSPPMAAQDEAVDLLVRGEKRTFGGLCFDGSCRMMDEYGANGARMFSSWHVFGDPSLRVFTDAPVKAHVDHASILDVASTDFTVVVPDVEGALCALSRAGESIGSAFTDAGGTAVIPLETAVGNGETLTLTVSGFNLVTYMEEVEVVPHPGCTIEPPAVQVSAHPGDNVEAELVIANDGDPGSKLEFRVEVLPPGGKSIAGSMFFTDHAMFQPGATCDLRFLIYNATADYEWIKGASIDFPRGVTVNASTDFTVIGQSRRICTNGASGNGAEVAWAASGAWGEIYFGEFAEATVNVTVDADFLNDMEIGWTLNGDGWGAPPHILYGTLDVPLQGPALLLLTPNGGEIWRTGDKRPIAWASSGGLEAVDLDYSVDNGVSWIPIESRSPNDGSIEWPVPFVNSEHCLVRVSSPDGSAVDGSDGAFRIVPPVTWLSLDRDSGEVVEGKQEEIHLSFDASALEPGSHEAVLLVSHNAGDPVLVPVHLHVTPYAMDPGLSTVEANDGVLLAPGGGTGGSLVATVTVRTARGIPMPGVPAGEVVLFATATSALGQGMHFCATGMLQAAFPSIAPTDSAGRATFVIEYFGGCGTIDLRAEVGGVSIASGETANVFSPDLNGDGIVNFQDAFLFTSFLRSGTGSCGNLDRDPQGLVNFADSAIFIRYFAAQDACP